MSLLPPANPTDNEPMEHSEFSCLRIIAGLHHRHLKGDRRKILEQISRFRTKGDVRRYGRAIETQLTAARAAIKR